MFVWTLQDCGDCSSILKMMIHNDVHAYHYQFLYLRLAHSRIDPTLKRLFVLILLNWKRKPNKINTSCVMEMTAALDYAFKNPYAGQLKLVRQICASSKTKPALHYLNAWVDKAMHQEMWKLADCWFRIRVLCMDVYTIAHICMCEPYTMCVFYGGDSHAQTVNTFLRNGGAKRVDTDPEIERVCSNQSLISIESYIWNNVRIVIIGEDHSKTNTQFGSDLIRFLQSKCHTNVRIVCLIEKHISNTKDDVQQKLSCNMPDMAIHRFRCDSFVTSHSCPNLMIIPVDNRHYDLGFIRMEIFLLWHECDEFRQHAVTFHKKCLVQLRSFCKNYRHRHVL